MACRKGRDVPNGCRVPAGDLGGLAAPSAGAVCQQLCPVFPVDLGVAFESGAN